jgi:hypothetical protein
MNYLRDLWVKVVTMQNIIYKIVSIETENERLVIYSLRGIFREKKFVQYVLEFSLFCNGDCNYHVCNVNILLCLLGIS